MEQQNVTAGNSITDALGSDDRDKKIDYLLHAVDIERIVLSAIDPNNSHRCYEVTDLEIGVNETKPYIFAPLQLDDDFRPYFCWIVPKSLYVAPYVIVPQIDEGNFAIYLFSVVDTVLTDPNLGMNLRRFENLKRLGLLRADKRRDIDMQRKMAALIVSRLASLVDMGISPATVQLPNPKSQIEIWKVASGAFLETAEKSLTAKPLYANSKPFFAIAKLLRSFTDDLTLLAAVGTVRAAVFTLLNKGGPLFRTDLDEVEAAKGVIENITARANRDTNPKTILEQLFKSASPDVPPYRRTGDDVTVTVTTAAKNTGVTVIFSAVGDLNLFHERSKTILVFGAYWEHHLNCLWIDDVLWKRAKTATEIGGFRPVDSVAKWKRLSTTEYNPPYSTDQPMIPKKRTQAGYMYNRIIRKTETVKLTPLKWQISDLSLRISARFKIPRTFIEGPAALVMMSPELAAHILRLRKIWLTRSHMDGTYKYLNRNDMDRLFGASLDLIIHPGVGTEMELKLIKKKWLEFFEVGGNATDIAPIATMKMYRNKSLTQGTSSKWIVSTVENDRDIFVFSKAGDSSWEQDTTTIKALYDGLFGQQLPSRDPENVIEKLRDDIGALFGNRLNGGRYTAPVVNWIGYSGETGEKHRWIGAIGRGQQHLLADYLLKLQIDADRTPIEVQLNATLTGFLTLRRAMMTNAISIIPIMDRVYHDRKSPAGQVYSADAEIAKLYNSLLLACDSRHPSVMQLLCCDLYALAMMSASFPINGNAVSAFHLNEQDTSALQRIVDAYRSLGFTPSDALDVQEEDVALYRPGSMKSLDERALLDTYLANSLFAEHSDFSTKFKALHETDLRSGENEIRVFLMESALASLKFRAPANYIPLAARIFEWYGWPPLESDTTTLMRAIPGPRFPPLGSALVLGPPPAVQQEGMRFNDVFDPDVNMAPIQELEEFPRSRTSYPDDVVHQEEVPQILLPLVGEDEQFTEPPAKRQRTDEPDFPFQPQNPFSLPIPQSPYPFTMGSPPSDFTPGFMDEPYDPSDAGGSMLEDFNNSIDYGPFF